MRLSEDFLAKKRRSCGEVSQNAPEHRRFRIRPLTEGEGHPGPRRSDLEERVMKNLVCGQAVHV